MRLPRDGNPANRASGKPDGKVKGKEDGDESHGAAVHEGVLKVARRQTIGRIAATAHAQGTPPVEHEARGAARAASNAPPSQEPSLAR